MGGSWRRPCFIGFRPADLPGLLAAWRRGLRSWHCGEQPLGIVHPPGSPFTRNRRLPRLAVRRPSGTRRTRPAPAGADAGTARGTREAAGTANRIAVKWSSRCVWERLPRTVASGDVAVPITRVMSAGSKSAVTQRIVRLEPRTPRPRRQARLRALRVLLVRSTSWRHRQYAACLTSIQRVRLLENGVSRNLTLERVVRDDPIAAPLTVPSASSALAP
jgi:hypothetical protein